MNNPTGIAIAPYIRGSKRYLYMPHMISSPFILYEKEKGVNIKRTRALLLHVF